MPSYLMIIATHVLSCRMPTATSCSQEPFTGRYLESSDMPGVPITAFTQLELAGNKIRYVHNSGDEMKMDSFEFEVTDGFNPVARTFRISLSDVDNRKPVLMFQTLRLKEGDKKLITPFELKAEDSDTPDESVIFTVTQVCGLADTAALLLVMF